MAEHVVSYAELDDFLAKLPKGEQLVSYDPSQNGAWIVVTEPKK